MAAAAAASLRERNSRGRRDDRRGPRVEHDLLPDNTDDDEPRRGGTGGRLRQKRLWVDRLTHITRRSQAVISGSGEVGLLAGNKQGLGELLAGAVEQVVADAQRRRLDESCRESKKIRVVE